MLKYVCYFRNLVSDIHGKTGQLLSRGTGSAQQVAGGGGSYQDQQALRVNIFYLTNSLVLSSSLYLGHRSTGSL